MEKPFWLRPPYLILFDLLRINKVRAWEVNLKEILGGFLKEMRKLGEVDFPASGIALLSSSILHRMKSESVLKMEEPPRIPEPRPEEPNLPPMPSPLVRFEHAPISITEMVKVLERALEREEKTRLAKNGLLFSPPATEQLSEFLLNIKEHVDELYSELVDKSSRGAVYFTEITKGLPPLQVVRIFLTLLFLANEGRINIEQEGEEDILITVVEPTQLSIGG